MKDTYKASKDRFRSTHIDTLSVDYYGLTQEEFSVKYGLSKTVWRPYLRSIGIQDKHAARIESYPVLKDSQKKLIIGSLLGDAGISESLRYYESHSLKQEQYLRWKYHSLKPYSTRIVPCDDNTSLRMYTTAHPVFKEFRDLFYSDTVSGKLIPVDYIWKNWDDIILAIWFFDDGNLDDVTGDITIANKCPDKNHLDDLSYRMSIHYGWEIHSGTQGDIYRLYFPKACRKVFGDLLLKYATPDVYYKIPEESLPRDITLSLDDNKTHPKLYRSGDDITKKVMEQRVFDHYRKNGFPYSSLTAERIKYLAETFSSREPVERNGTIEHNTAGLSLCEHFFPNIYDCRRQAYQSPRALWDSDDFLRKLVVNRLRYSDRINDASMRRGLKLSRHCVSNFKPMVALYLYKKYGGKGRVFDYSAGFGARMLAAMSLGMTYVGCEPSTATLSNLEKFGTYLKKATKGDFRIVPTGSETYCQGSYDFIFSSPPYFDFEWYSDDPGQSILRFPDYQGWLEGFWRQTIRNAHAMLDAGGHFGVCLSPYCRKGILQTTLDIAKEENLFFVTDYKCPFKQVLGGPGKYEVVLIFSKAEPPSVSEPRFVLSPGIEGPREDTFSKDLKSYRKVYTVEEIENARVFFVKSTSTSRNTFKNCGINGIPIHVLEHRYGSWNSFVRAAGHTPGYEAKGSSERIQEYFEACVKFGRVLSFYEYEKETGNPATRLKRLFNKGKKYYHLKSSLFDCALDVVKQNKFLETIKSIR